MADQLLLGLFDNIGPASDAIADLRTIGIDDKQVTVMSGVPYSSKLLGRKMPRTFYGPFVLAGAIGGLLIGLFIVIGTPQLYKIHVGGQALTPFPPSAIIVGEFIALGIMAAAFVGFLLQNSFPVLRRQLYDRRITEGMIGIQVQAHSSVAERVQEVFRAYSPHDITVVDADDYRSPGIRHLFFWGAVATGGLVALLIPLLMTYRIIKVPWLDSMNQSPALSYQEGPRFAAPEGSIPIQGPVTLIGADGQEYPATEPIATSPELLERGQTLFGIYCYICHGTAGAGNGPVTKYFPEAPALNSERIQGLPADHIFMVITRGHNRMPSLTEPLTTGETWDIVNYVLSLGEAAPAGTNQ